MALGFMRRHRRWLYVFLWLVIAAFIILYIPAFQGAITGSPGDTLARVGGLAITVSEFQKAYLQQRRFYERLYQGRLDAAAFRRLGLEDQVLENLVADRLVRLEARRLGLTVDDVTVARTLAISPEFQENGRFLGGEEIKKRLDLQGVSVEEFEESLRNRLLREKLVGLVTDGVSVTAAEAEREYRRRTEQVKAEYVLVDASRFRPEITVGDEEVKARFEAKPESYRVPEKRVIAYVLVDDAALRPRVSVSERDLEQYYQEHKDEFKEEAQVCARHILVKVKASPEAKEGHPDGEARKIAQGLLDQLKAGADFAALAKKHSEDLGSAPAGGGLGCFPRGRMVPEFDNAAFSLDDGQLSDLVKTGFGYHTIQVTSHKEEIVPALGAVKERVREIVTGQKVEALANQEAEAIAAALGRGRTLEAAAREQGLTVQKSPPLAAGEVKDPLASPLLRARAFELRPGEASREAFSLPRGTAFISLAEVQPSRLPERKEVEDKVRADIAEEKALDKARARALEVKSRADKVGLDKAAAALGLARKETPSLTSRSQPFGDLGSGAALDEAAFALPEKTLSDPVRVAAGYAVLRVLEKKPFDALVFEQQRGAIMASVRQEKRNELFQDYLNMLRRRFAVERNVEAFKRVVGPG